jgi:hypothetical protein
MVAATIQNKTYGEMPGRKAIRNLTAEIRHGWTVGERHYRARLALALQYHLATELRCCQRAG